MCIGIGRMTKYVMNARDVITGRASVKGYGHGEFQVALPILVHNNASACCDKEHVFRDKSSTSVRVQTLSADMRDVAQAS